VGGITCGDGKHGHLTFRASMPRWRRLASAGKPLNAQHVKNILGRKTDIGNAQWLATLTRAGLLRGSFVPPAKLRELHLISWSGRS
jgi:hypothetical protein